MAEQAGRAIWHGWQNLVGRLKVRGGDGTQNMLGLDELVAFDLAGTADWRRSKVIEFPNDHRNSEAAEILDRLASEVSKLEGTDRHKRLAHLAEETAEDGKFSVFLSDLTRLVGFRLFPDSAEDFIDELIYALEQEHSRRSEPEARGIDMYSVLLADARKLGEREVALVEAFGRDRAELLLVAAINKQQISPFVTDTHGNKKLPRTFFDLIERELRTIPNLKLIGTDAILKTVVNPEKGLDAGRLVAAVALPWFDIVNLLQREQNAAYEIPPDKWEEIIAGAYKNAGYEEVILTPRSGDYGRDVIAVKKGIGQIRVIDQVKAYKPPHLVTANDVRALIGVLESDGASKAFLTTTSDFAPVLRDDPLVRKWMPSRLGLTGRVDLFNQLAEIAARAKGLIIGT